MTMTKRNVLCIKNKEKLDLGKLLLYEPYKNIVLSLYDLAIRIEAKDFDPVAKVYDGLLSTPSDIKDYYEALLGVTSYYQHSQGGKGKYIEKKLSTSFNTCAININLSKIFSWLEYPDIYKKKGIFTDQGLSSGEKEKLRATKWSWLGDSSAEIDVGAIHKREKTITLIEVKNRVDTGGSAGRREIWTSKKFEIWVDYILNNTKIFECENIEYSLLDLLKYFRVNNLELYIGVLFDKQDCPADINSDRRNGFYSSSKEGFNHLKEKIKKHGSSKILKIDEENLLIKFERKGYDAMNITMGGLYGDNVSLKLFRKRFPVSDLLLLRYDDMWLFQLLAIDERANLLRFGSNTLLEIKRIVERDYSIRELFNRFVISEGGGEELSNLLAAIKDKIDNRFISDKKNKENYISDLLYFYGSKEC